MSRMLHSVTWRNYFCNLAHFPHCSHTQQIRELFKLKTTTFHILGFCEKQLSYTEARQGQACWSQASTEGGSINLLSHFNDTDDHKKRASYIRHGWKYWMDPCKSTESLRSPALFPLGDPAVQGIWSLSRQMPPLLHSPPDSQHGYLLGP